MYRFLPLTVSAAFASLTYASLAPWRGLGGLPVPRSPSRNGKTCTAYAYENQKDDAPQTPEAFNGCNNGTVVFPENRN
jgi:hypothetical protein